MAAERDEKPSAAILSIYRCKCPDTNSRGLIRPLSKSYREGVQMTGIERLVDIVNDGPYSGGMIHISVQKLREICEQIEREVADISGYESDVLAFVEEKGGLEVIKERLRETMPRAAHDRINRRKNRRIRELENELEDMRGRLIPEGCEWDGSVLRIRTAEDVDYDGETLFVLIGGRDE